MTRPAQKTVLNKKTGVRVTTSEERANELLKSKEFSEAPANKMVGKAPKKKAVTKSSSKKAAKKGKRKKKS